MSSVEKARILNKLEMAQGYLASARVDAIEAGEDHATLEIIERVEDLLVDIIQSY